MTRLLALAFLAFLLPLAAQDVRVIRLSESDAKTLAVVAEQKRLADANWLNAEKYLRNKYATVAGVAKAGAAQVEVQNPVKDWEWGVEFSDDYALMIAKRKPCEVVEPQ